MPQRSISAGQEPHVTIHAGWDVTISGWASDRVQVNTAGHFGCDIERRGEEIQASVGRSGEIYVPLGSRVTLYSGRNAEVSGLAGSATVVAGGSARIAQVATLVHISAGGAMDIDCERLASASVKFNAGRDLRFRVRELHDATFVISDIGGRWQAVMGNGSARIVLQAGGEVILVTDQEVQPWPPDGPLGCVQRPERLLE